MAEQSSTAVVFRGLVMLICLILIPVAAFCGSSFPAVLKTIQSGRWPTLADFRGPPGPSSVQPTEAPRYMPQATGLPQATDPKMLGFSGTAGAYRPASQGETTRSPVVAVNYTAPVTPSPNDPNLSTSFPQNKDPGIAPNRRLSPVSAGADNLLPLDHPATSTHPDALASRGELASSLSPSDQFKYVQDRLRHLGATYFVLETCGDEKRDFRFYCRMSMGGNPRVTKPFWCFDSDPLRAMTQVLKQVEDWQTGGG